jgi:K+-transporting ATPase KdpF subunit
MYSRAASCAGKEAMFEAIALLALCGGLLIYLVVALLWPEKF